MAQQLERIIHNIDELRNGFTEASVMFKSAPKKHQLIFTSEYEEKTHPQLAYLHKIVLPLLASALFDAGIINLNSKSVAKDWLKEEAQYGSYYVRTANGRPEARFVGKSFADIKKPRMIEIINLAIERCAFLGCAVPEPTEFSLTKGDK